MILKYEVHINMSRGGSRMSGGDPRETQNGRRKQKWFPHERG